MTNLICKIPRHNIVRGLATAQNAFGARKNAEGLPWREAASLILISPKEQDSTDKTRNGASEQPHFLVTKRSPQSTTFSNILCFPGGNISVADDHPEWLNKVKNTFIKNSCVVPEIYASPMGIPKALSLRVTAIRETFEETGILLCKKNGKDSPVEVRNATAYTFDNPEVLKSWQEKIRSKPEAFLEMCDELSIIPDVTALVEWSNWLTPNCFGRKRFDTIFYMALVNKPYPMFLCPKEVESASWSTPNDVLNGFIAKKYKMMPPQIYELTRLKSTSMTQLQELMRIRLSLGIERWCPAFIKAKDGNLFIFPGDDLYPKDMKVYENEAIRSIKKTLDELRETCSSQNRVENRSEFDFKVVIKNYKERAGHFYLDF